MMEVAQNPQGTTTRVVYVDLDDEIDGDEELEFGVWLPKDGDIPVLCSSHCHEVSNSALDQTEKISRTFCSQRGAEIVAHAPICNSDAVDEITQKWPHREPYALARPSESGDISRGRRRRNKERSNYAKALLRSDTELDKLSRKIRLEIQQSEMLELAIEAERAANAGFLSFSARPSTFGLDPLQVGHDRNLWQTSTFSQQPNPTLLLRTPSEKMLKPCELRNVTEVIPRWKHLHSHVRTHLFRRKVHEAALVFSEKESPSLSKHWKASFENSASDIARQSLKFLGDFADSTVRKLRSRHGTHTRAMCEPTQYEKGTTHGTLASESSLFGPTLSSHLSPLPHGDKFWRPLLSVPHGLLHPDEANEIASTAANVGSSLDLPFLHHSICKPGQEKPDRFCHCTRLAKMEMGPSSPSSRMQTYDNESTKYQRRSRAGLVQSSVLDTDDVSLQSSKSLPTTDISRMDWNFIQHHKWHRQKRHMELGYETPVRLRDIRGQSEWNNLAHTSLFSPLHCESEGNDLTVLTFSEALDNQLLDDVLCKSSDDEEKKDCEHSNSGGQYEPRRESALLDYPFSLPHTCQGDDDMHSNETIDEVSILTPQNPASFDIEYHEESPSVSASQEEPLSAMSGDLSGSTRALRNTYSWPLHGLAVPEFPMGTSEPYNLNGNESQSFNSDSVPSAQKTKDTISSSENHGMCHTLPSADENFQSAVEEMLSRLSPNITACRRDLFMGESDNDEFLNNYFYRTKLTGKNPTPACSHTNERVYVGFDSLCHVIGVDAVCSGFRFIFSEQAHRPAVTSSRQRSVSLDGRRHNKTPSRSSWYTTLEGMLNHFGSSHDSSPHEVDPLHFDPPYLRKASFAKN